MYTSLASVVLWQHNYLFVAYHELVDTSLLAFSLPLGVETDQTLPHSQLGPSCLSWQSGTCMSSAGGTPPCTSLPSHSVFGGVVHELGRQMATEEEDEGLEWWASPC